MQEAGYQIGRDAGTGFWTLSFAQQGPEYAVSIYEIHTTVTPGPVSSQTVSALHTFFLGLSPPATDRILIGGTALSGTYIHLAVVTQQNTTDNSTSVRSTLTSAGLGYNTGNTTVSKR